MDTPHNILQHSHIVAILSSSMLAGISLTQTWDLSTVRFGVTDGLLYLPQVVTCIAGPNGRPPHLHTQTPLSLLDHTGSEEGGTRPDEGCMGGCGCGRGAQPILIIV